MKAVMAGLGSVAILMSGTVTAAPIALQDHPSTQPPATGGTQAKPAEAPPPPPQFLDDNGNPLPSDIQRDLEKQFKGDLVPKKSEAPQPPAPTASAPTPASDGDILVSGRRPRGSVIGDIPPERTFSSLDLNAYGADNIGELIQALGPQVTNGRGGDSNPVTLLNGRRVSSFTEIAEIPAEAIERMEVFPEELALKYGYRADQKVVNIVTFEKFRSKIGQLGSSLPTDGGYDTARIGANYFAIQGDTRYDLSAEYNRSAALLESDRDLAQLGNNPDAGGFRTLLPEAERVALNGLVSGNLLNNVSSTLNGRLERNRSQSLLGLGPQGTLLGDTDTRAAHLGTTLGGRLGKWLWSFTSNYDRSTTDTSIDTGTALGTKDEARSVNSVLNADLVLSGSLLKLPAGPIATSIRVGGDTRDFSSRSLRSGVEQRAELPRDRGAIQASLDVPIASRRAKELTWLGNFSLNVNLATEQLSDFGGLRTFGYGFNWSPIEELNIIASATDEERAPTVEQLGAPLVVTPNVRTFDFTRREIADVARTFGGNPNLRSDDRHVFRLGVTTKPFAKTDFTFSIEYLKTRINDPIAPFPIATPDIEAAFPERFTRGIDGRLLQIDSTPLNFERSDQEQVRWGLSFVRHLGAVEPWMRSAPVRTYSSESEARAAAPAGTMVAMVQPGSAMARRFENLTSRLYLNLYYTLQLRDDILVRQDLPKLDLLDGAATDILGGTRRHRLELQAGLFKKGLGARVTANWQSGTTVRGLGGDAGDLTFSNLATVNTNLFANLDDRFGGSKAPQWLKGTRVTFGITNIFNTRPQVRDRTGATPLSYQSAYLDPLGRVVSFGLRKVF
jgi:hypothetical protein